eukprot:scaffold104031_cov33-Tisochrysis_lutea.AAC.1
MKIGEDSTKETLRRRANHLAAVAGATSSSSIMLSCAQDGIIPPKCHLLLRELRVERVGDNATICKDKIDLREQSTSSGRGIAGVLRVPLARRRGVNEGAGLKDRIVDPALASGIASSAAICEAIIAFHKRGEGCGQGSAGKLGGSIIEASNLKVRSAIGVGLAGRDVGRITGRRAGGDRAGCSSSCNVTGLSPLKMGGKVSSGMDAASSPMLVAFTESISDKETSISWIELRASFGNSPHLAIRATELEKGAESSTTDAGMSTDSEVLLTFLSRSAWYLPTRVSLGGLTGRGGRRCGHVL